jgi:hypothetical protein
VPDAALLPTESIRFFHVDYNWTDRLIDGVFAAANTGTVDATFTYSVLKGVRERLDEGLEKLAKAQITGSSWKAGKDPLTGLLIRSDLVRRWPDMVVEAYATAAETSPLPVLRREPLSKDIYIALFAGQPARVDICEPPVGTRFGVEGTEIGNYHVDARDTNGQQATNVDTLDIAFRNEAKRVLNYSGLLDEVTQHIQPRDGSARMIALQLEQRAFQQIFSPTMAESRGVVSPMTFVQTDGSVLNFKLSRGRQMNMGRFVARLRELGLENE